LGQVLGEGHVTDPVQPVLDAPVPAQRISELSGGALRGGEVGDGVDRFGAPPAAGGRPSSAGDLQGQGRLGEANPGADSGELDAAVFGPAVTLA